MTKEVAEKVVEKGAVVEQVCNATVRLSEGDAHVLRAALECASRMLDGESADESLSYLERAKSAYGVGSSAIARLSEALLSAADRAAAATSRALHGSGMVIVGFGKGWFSVSSESDPRLSYRVTTDEDGHPTGCACESYRRYLKPCKHMKLVEAARRN